MHTISSQTPNRHPATLITVHILNQHILTRALDTNTLIPIRHFNIMQVTIIRACHIYPICSP